MSESADAEPGKAGAKKAKVKDKGLRISRVWTTEGVHPYEEVAWVRRDVVMTNWRDGSINFEQRGVEFPEFWSVNATNIVTSKYFRGAVGTDKREHSLKQLIDRVVKTYRAAGEQHGYFATTADADVFEAELAWLLLHQYFSFNSPVWFNVGTESLQQVSACQPYDAMVSTPAGLVPIGKLVEDKAVDAKVYDAHGLTKILAVKANGVKDVLRIHTKAGYTLDVTADHLVWKSLGERTGRFVEAGTLREGDQLEWRRRDSYGEQEVLTSEIYEAALAGWLQSDGFVGQYDSGTNRSLTIEAMVVNAEERMWVKGALEKVFPGAHMKERSVETQDTSLDCRRIRLYGEHLRPFVDKWGLTARGVDMTVPEQLYTAPLAVVQAYLTSIFQAEGYVAAREKSTLVAAGMISEELMRGVQKLLLRFGIFSRVSRNTDKRPDRHDIWTVRIQNEGDRDLFAAHVGFICGRKTAKLEASFDKPGKPAADVKRLQIARIENLGPMEVYDIQTESGEYLSGNLRVHNCFILSVDDSMDSILDWYKEEGLIFKGGSGSGVNLSKIRSSKELLSSGGNASGPVSFMRGADASAGTIKSGGATRRAAKMVVLDVDHPDIEEFIDTKAREEDKIRALRDAGFDMDLGGKDIVSVQYQNANNSVRVSDEFMRAVEQGTDFPLRARMDGAEVERVDAKGLFRKMAEAAWECADPGIQYDDTINDWHTNPETGRITASNPCFPADQRVVTDKGLIRIGDLVSRSAAGEKFSVYTNDVTSEESPESRVVATDPTRYMVTGTNQIVKLEFSDGSMLRCTPNHRVWTSNRGWVRANELGGDDKVVRSFHYSPRSMASWEMPREAVEAAKRVAKRSSRHSSVDLPEKWDVELAHYMGWLVGDGCLTDLSTVTVYGTAKEQETVLPRHRALLSELTGVEYKPSVQPNGTVQLCAGAGALRAFFAGLGVRPGSSNGKVVPESIFEAPEEVVADFLQGLYDADGCAVELANGTRYVGLASRSKQLLRGVQELLASLGIAGRIYETGVKKSSFTYTRKDGTTATYDSDGPMYDLRVTGRSMREFAAQIGFSLETKSDKLRATTDFRDVYKKDETVRLVSRDDDGFETTYNLTEPRNHSYIVGGVVIANCSEYMHIDNSSCNLASLNLMKFVKDDGSFDVEKFVKATEFVITAMEISIAFADFPTEAITRNTKAHRQLGIGYANLGALLMASGFAYDSDEGRAVAAAVTALMTGASYRRSAEIAGVVGPYDAYGLNAEAHKRVMRKHAAACDELKTHGAMDHDILKAAVAEWQSGNKIGEKNGWRNAQASVIAPTGTIGFMMDCDTTGIEPDLALVKYKKLVGGGSMQIVNQTVPRALKRLGYQDEQIEAIVEYISEHGHVVDAPSLRPEHYSVFDCAMGDRSISPMGHVRMMAAAQPWVSGAISKTVNVPESAGVEDFENIYFESWKLGLKALAVYRENSKVGQPLSVSKNGGDRHEVEKIIEYRPVRKRLPKKRPSQTVSFTVGGAEGYMTASSYPDDGLGEVFFKMSKQGSTLAGIMDAFSVAISIALQYGVPLEKYIEKFTNMRFEPAGMTDDPDIRMAASVVDYLFRRLALDHLPYAARAELGILTAAERAAEARGDDPASVYSDEEQMDMAALASSAPVELVARKIAEAGPQTVHSSTEAIEAVQGKAADAP
ncbi:MAG: LAGLIDADG family homing endonuclease, partial [Stackebrandtia sp.]